MALGVRPAIAACTLRTTATADDAANPDDHVDGGTIAAGTVYPYIRWSVALGASCHSEPLTFGDLTATVTTTYTATGRYPTHSATRSGGVNAVCAGAATGRVQCGSATRATWVFSCGATIFASRSERGLPNHRDQICAPAGPTLKTVCVALRPPRSACCNFCALRRCVAAQEAHILKPSNVSRVVAPSLRRASSAGRSPLSESPWISNSRSGRIRLQQ